MEILQLSATIHLHFPFGRQLQSTTDLCEIKKLTCGQLEQQPEKLQPAWAPRQGNHTPAQEEGPYPQLLFENEKTEGCHFSSYFCFVNLVNGYFIRLLDNPFESGELEPTNCSTEYADEHNILSGGVMD